MHDTPRRSPAARTRRGLSALVLDPLTRSSVLVGALTWIAVSAAIAGALVALGFDGAADLPRTFVLAVGFGAGAAVLLAHGCGRSFLGSADVLPTLAGLGVYALPVLATSALPWAVLGPARVDFAGAVGISLLVAPLLLLAFALLSPFQGFRKGKETADPGLAPRATLRHPSGAPLPTHQKAA